MTGQVLVIDGGLSLLTGNVHTGLRLFGVEDEQWADLDQVQQTLSQSKREKDEHQILMFDKFSAQCNHRRASREIQGVHRTHTRTQRSGPRTRQVSDLPNQGVIGS
jgi:hypothetical protein